MYVGCSEETVKSHHWKVKEPNSLRFQLLTISVEIVWCLSPAKLIAQKYKTRHIYEEQHNRIMNLGHPQCLVYKIIRQAKRKDENMIYIKKWSNQ